MRKIEAEDRLEESRGRRREKHALQKRDLAREEELRELVLKRYLDALNSLVGALSGLSIPVSIFAYYTVVDKRTLDPATAFTVPVGF